MVSIALQFPLGVYHAQSQSDFAVAEWPPHPVRLIAALVAAAHGGPADDLEATRAVIERLAQSDAPVIVAPRLAGAADAGEDEHAVAQLRGASRWAPRNHELAELKKGISPRDLGRGGRAAVHKVGVAIGDLPVTFTWSTFELSTEELRLLRQVAGNVSFVGTSRSPVLVDVVTAPDAQASKPAWRPAADDAPAPGSASVRVPNARTLSQLDAWHAARSVPVATSGSPSRSPLVVAPRLGSVVAYAHDSDPRELTRFDAQHWGEMLMLAVTGEIVPKSPASFAFARALRKALLDTYAEPGNDGEAPPILRGRGSDPHAAVVPLSFVAPFDSEFPGAKHADGSVLGVAVLLPHHLRIDRSLEGPRLAEQRAAVVNGLMRFVLDANAVLVPGVGPVGLAPVTGRVPATLQEARYRRASARWTTITPVVHSRYRTRNGLDAMLEQVTAECRDVGLPAPAKVEVRRTAALRGAPDRISSRALPASWTGPLKGPQAHLDIWFDRPVHGPLLLGRARHFGLGLCLPLDARGQAS